MRPFLIILWCYGSATLAASNWSDWAVSCPRVETGNGHSIQLVRYAELLAPHSEKQEWIVNHKPAENKGLVPITARVALQKTALFDSLKRNETVAGNIEREIRFYAVKVKVSADQEIGADLTVCNPPPVKEVELRLLCEEFRTRSLDR